jgi:AcrR family transcriptional regulator
MPPARTRPRRADAARNKQLLLDAARQLIDESGPAVVMDEVARRAGVANATLYRNFPARTDLLVAVYAGDVDELCQQGTALLQDASPGTALTTWMDSFVRHVAATRPLALAATENSEQRGELFARWHQRMASTAAPLLARAQHAGAVRGDLTARDILALANAAAIAGTGPDDARRLLDLMRHGFAANQDAAQEADSPAAPGTAARASE